MTLRNLIVQLACFVCLTLSMPGFEPALAAEEAAADGQHSATQSASLLQRCNALSEQSEYQYKLVSGEIIKVGAINPYSLFQPNCDGLGWEECREKYYAQPASFGFLVKLVGQESEVLVRAKVGTVGDMLRKEPYMKAGRNYSFCARDFQVEDGDPFARYTPTSVLNQTKYQIDHVDTIQFVSVSSLESMGSE